MPHGLIAAAGKDKQLTGKYFNYVLAHVCMRKTELKTEKKKQLKTEACAWHLMVFIRQKSRSIYDLVSVLQLDTTGAAQTKSQ